MVILRRIAGAAMLISAMMAAGSAFAQDAGLDRFQWEARPFLVFAPDRTDPLLQKQSEEFEDAAAGLTDRDVVWIEVVRGRPVLVDGVEAPSLAGSALRARFGVAAGQFAVTLVGRDGGASSFQPETGLRRKSHNS